MQDERPLRVLMVCTGNLCRSPLAELMVDRVAITLGVEVEARSGGTAGIVGQPSPRLLVAVAREMGLDLSGHRSKALSEEQVAWADHILVMEGRHQEFVLAQFGEAAADKVTSLGPLVGRPEIEDPMGSWFKGPYRKMRGEVEKGLTAFLREATGSRW